MSDERLTEKDQPWHKRRAVHWAVCPIRSRWRRYRYHQPFWRDDKTALMLGIGQTGCRRCGRGCVIPPGDDNGPAVVKQCGICTALGHTSDEHAASDNSLPPGGQP